MLFPTTDFAIFLAVVFALHWILNRYPLPWKLFMIAASYVFYAWWDPGLVWLLALVSLLAQAGGLAVARASDARRRRWAMGVGVGLVLLPLLWFKYYGFFALNASNGLNAIAVASPFPLLQVVLPVGISFYTFMAVSYVVDIARRDIEPAGWLDLFQYLSFFPHLVAGPIVRGRELIPQLRAPRDPERIDLAGSGWLILGGLFKKVVISSYLSTAIVDPVFADPNGHAALDVLFAIYAYAIVIYADFSGYTDIAIGVAQLLGFRFPQNFDRPYAARSLQDFWRRWHMTLSRWLRDYLYIPFGGSRRGEARAAAAIMATMLLGGLWHGAGWTFVLWGGLHGAGQVVGRRRRRRRELQGREPLGAGAWAVARQRLVTFHLVCAGWVFFRAESLEAALAMFGRLGNGWAARPSLVSPLLVAVIAGALAMQYVPRWPADQAREWLAGLRPVAVGAAFGLALFAITTLGPQGVAPFIYFRF